MDFEAEIKMMHIYTQCRWKSSILRMRKFENLSAQTFSFGFCPRCQSLEESYSQHFIFPLSLGEYVNLSS